MKIAIVGYGKMGRMIERLAVGKGIEIGPKLDRDGTRLQFEDDRVFGILGH